MRKIVSLDHDIECKAPSDMFNKWEQVSEETKEEIIKNGPIPCEGSGKIGRWCFNCRFAEVWEL